MNGSGDPHGSSDKSPDSVNPRTAPAGGIPRPPDGSVIGYGLHRRAPALSRPAIASMIAIVRATLVVLAAGVLSIAHPSPIFGIFPSA